MTTSLIEGCAFSVICCNALFAVLVRRVRNKVPEVKVTFFVDDSKLRTTRDKLDRLAEACNIFREFDRLSDQECNGKKCRAFATTQAARREVGRLLPPGGMAQLNPLALGFAIVTSRKGARAIHDDRCKQQWPYLERLTRLPGKKNEHRSWKRRLFLLLFTARYLCCRPCRYWSLCAHLS